MVGLTKPWIWFSSLIILFPCRSWWVWGREVLGFHQHLLSPDHQNWGWAAAGVTYFSHLCFFLKTQWLLVVLKEEAEVAPLASYVPSCPTASSSGMSHVGQLTIPQKDLWTHVENTPDKAYCGSRKQEGAGVLFHSQRALSLASQAWFQLMVFAPAVSQPGTLTGTTFRSWNKCHILG